MSTRLMDAKDYDKIAQEIVNDFLGQSKPLADNVATKAKEIELNPEQVKNLVHAVNALTTLALMDAKTDGDKYVEFEPVEPKVVMKRIYITSGGNSMGTSNSPDFPAELMGDLASQCSEGCSGDGHVTEDREPPRSVLIMRIQKAAEALEGQKTAAAWDYQEQLDKLASEFAKLYGPNLEEFEKDAFNLYGDSALPLIADLHRCLKLEAPKSDGFSKTACAKRCVETDNPQMKTFDRMLKLSKDYSDCAAGMAYLKSQVGHLL